MHISFDKIDGFIRVYDGTRYLVLFGFENYLQLYKSKKQYNIYVFSLLYEKSKLILSILYLWKKYLTLHNLIILIKRLLNKDQNHYEKKFALGVFIDSSRPFDKVDHKILIKKLQKYEIKYQYIDWFNCYLNDRKQYVQ